MYGLLGGADLGHLPAKAFIKNCCTTSQIHYHRFPVYDSDNFSPARYFLPRRLGLLPNATAYSVTTAVSDFSILHGNTCIVCSNFIVSVLYAQANRWRLEADLSGMANMAAMMVRMQQMSDMYVSVCIQVRLCCWSLPIPYSFACHE